MAVSIGEITTEVVPEPATPPAAASAPREESPSELRRQREQLEQIQQRLARTRAD